jgi:hypothetical protein
VNTFLSESYEDKETEKDLERGSADMSSAKTKSARKIPCEEGDRMQQNVFHNGKTIHPSGEGGVEEVAPDLGGVDEDGVTKGEDAAATDKAVTGKL